MIKRVELSRFVMKQLRKLPQSVIKRLYSWIDTVEDEGLENIRKISGYHDEPLKGQRQGYRSIRLGIHWRAIYTVRRDKVEFVFVEEVNKHDY